MKVSKSKNNRIWIYIVSVILILSAGIGVWIYVSANSKPQTNNDKSTVTEKTTAPVDTKPAVPVIHMAAMGDMLAHDTIIANAKVGDSYDFSKYFVNILPIYKDANAVFCNQEGLVSGEQYGISGYPSFNAPTKFAADLQTGARCNVINLANNHMGDKGVAATNATIDIWTQLKPLAISGANKSEADQNKISYGVVEGIKIGFVAFADFNNNNSTPGYSVNIYHNESLVRSLVTTARANADVVIVSMHWGVEDSSVVSADQLNQTNLLSSLGVDVIIGTGPHVLQKADIINRSDSGKTLVWYSLGNMLSSQLNLKELIGGVAQFDITKTVDKKITISNPTFTPTYMHYEWTATEAANGNLLARKNAMIYPLADAAVPLSKSLLGTTVAEQKQYVIDTLGPAVTVR